MTCRKCRKKCKFDKNCRCRKETVFVELRGKMRESAGKQRQGMSKFQGQTAKYIVFVSRWRLHGNII